jgi:hypothetical protein
MDAIKPGTASAYWQNLQSGCVKDFKGFPTGNEVTCIVQVARQAECSGFVSILEEEIQELIQAHHETLTNYIAYIHNTEYTQKHVLYG